MLDKIIEIIMTVLPFLGSSRKKRKVMAQEVKEFSELVKDQYTFLMQQLEKVLKDYFEGEGNAYGDLFTAGTTCTGGSPAMQQ